MAFIRLLSYAARLYSQMFWIVWRGCSWQGLACVRPCVCVPLCALTMAEYYTHIKPHVTGPRLWFHQYLLMRMMHTQFTCQKAFPENFVFHFSTNNEDLANVEARCCYFWTVSVGNQFSYIQRRSENVVTEMEKL